MSETVTRVARAMAESAGFCWDNCAQSQWERDARAGIKALRNFNTEDFTLAEAAGIRRLIDEALEQS